MSTRLSIAIKSAIRNFQKHWQYGSLNILGLAIAFATLILVMIYLNQETTYEVFHENADRIYRPTYSYSNQAGYEVQFARIPNDFINELPKDIPEIEKLIRFQNKEQKYIRINDQRFKPKHAYITDGDVFDVFTLPLITGNSETALVSPNTVVLTERMAKKYFGSKDVIGKKLMVTGDYSDEEQVFKVTGVMQDLPVNTHLPIDLLFSFGSEEERKGWAYIYTLLGEGTSIESVEAKMNDFVAKYDNSEFIAFPFQSLKGIHLQSNLAREIKSNGQLLYIKIFFWVGLFVWLIALVNFANLSAALAMSRGKEIGVRKVLGASKGNLVFFSLAETIIYSLLALLFGGILAVVVFPTFSNLTGIQLLPPLPSFIAVLVGIAILTGLLAGILPATIATSMKMLQIIKQGNNWSMKSRSKGINVKRGMIAIQFCATIILMGSALIAWQQFKYINNKNLGLKSEQIIGIPSVPSKVIDNYITLKNRLKEISGIQQITACMQIPSSEIRDVGPVLIHGANQTEDQVSMMDMQIIDPDFMQMMELELLVGEDFTTNEVLKKVPTYSETLTPQQYLADTPRKYLINETAMKQLGWNDPAEAIGQQINWSIGNFQLAYGPVTGIIKDYHQESLRNKVDPLLLTVEPIWLSNILIKVETQNLEKTIANIEHVWNDLFPYALEYSFLDELFNKLYRQDRVQLQLLGILSIIAILISFLGLIGLVAFALKTRSKELAIRRVIGANLTNLTMLIGKEYLWILSIATLVGIPISYQWVSEWLQQFAYHIDISPLVYLVAIVLIFGLLIGTIYLQTFKATVENPVEALRED
ncbi:MAG: ABC transporter permease [Bacteroidetes bacterium]|nr:ABC transporter permease [Bacteroidota bacterium]